MDPSITEIILKHATNHRHDKRGREREKRQDLDMIEEKEMKENLKAAKYIQIAK